MTSPLPAPASPMLPPASPEERAWRRMALAFGLLAVAAAVIGIGAVDAWVNALVEIALYTATAVIMLLRLRRGGPWPWHAVLFPLFALNALVLLQWAWPLSRYPAATLDGLCGLIACLCVYYLALIGFQDESNYRWAARALWFFAGAVAIEAILQRFTSDGVIFWFRDATQDAIPIGPFTYHNYFAAFCELLLPLVAVATVRGLGRTTHWSAMVRRGMIPALVLAAFAITGSRGGALALIAEIFLGAAAVRYRWRSAKHPRRFGLWIGAGGLCLAFSVLAGWGTLANRFAALSPREPSVADRWRVAISCLHIWQRYPWFGSGLGTFPAVYPGFRLFDNGLTFLQAHNDTLQFLAETGGIGAALALLALVLLLISGWRSAMHPQFLGSTTSDLKLATLIGCLGFLVHCCEDFVAHSPANLYLFCFLAAMASATVVHRRRKPARFPPSARGIAVAAAAAVGVSFPNAAPPRRHRPPAPRTCNSAPRGYPSPPRRRCTGFTASPALWLYEIACCSYSRSG